MPTLSRLHVPALVLAWALAWPATAGDAAPVVPEPARHEFHFVVLGDSQFNDPATFNRMIDDVRHLNPAFVIQVGDMIDGYAEPDEISAQWQRFRSQVAPLGQIPFVPVPGNHDLYGPERRAEPEIEAIYRGLWGPTYRSFDYRNARFIVLNSDAPGAERRIGEAQLAWLEARLAESTAEHVFVFLHRPPATLDDAAALHALLRRFPVRFVFYGHQHHYHYLQRDGVRYVMTNAAADNVVPYPEVGGYDHFLLVTVRDGDAGFAVVHADAIEPPDSADAEANQVLFALWRGLAPEQVALAGAGPQRWTMDLPIANPTGRPLTAYLSCTSADDRWRFEPAALPALALAPGAQQTVRVTAAHDADRVPESEPACSVQVLVQTRFGAWLPFTRTVTGHR
ncbi:MAG: metallophosphoesterase [Pseudomonadales bacterium]